MTYNSGLCCDNPSALRALRIGANGMLPDKCVVVGFECSYQ